MDDIDEKFSDMDISQLVGFLKTLSEGIRKTISGESNATKTIQFLHPAYMSAKKGDRLRTLANLLEFRRNLIPIFPFYEWGKKIMVSLPEYEARVINDQDPSIAIRELMDILSKKIHEYRVLRDQYQNDWILGDKMLRKKTARMLQRQEKKLPPWKRKLL